MELNNAPTFIPGCLAGDERAIEQMILEYQTGVFRLALSVLDDPVEANEAAQDAFIAALSALKSYQERASFKAWLYTITLNISRSRLRKRQTIARLKQTLVNMFQVQIQKEASPEDTVIKNEKDAALWAAIMQLGEKHRLPIVLRYFHDLPITEIAAILHLNEGTVHSRLFVGRERLRTELEKQVGLTGE